MAEPICEDEGLLQEWAPLTQLIQQIPLKVQKGLFSQNLNLTCLDVVSDYIAIGTNANIIYWYCRVNGELQRLRLENSNSSVACVKVVSTVDYMVAAGTSQGTVTVFQIPKVVPDSIPDQLKPKKNQIERFTINGLHKSIVTNIEWSQNGMKLFSGDKNGLVVLTEIDFASHLSKSIELLNERFEIIQLNYNQQLLLISTLYRSIICDGTNNWKIYQVGTKERKILGKFGATFSKSNKGLTVYACRPGCRLWLADKIGMVKQTLIFKSVIHSACPSIQILNPVNKKQPNDMSFGKLIPFGDNKLISYNSEILYILHPEAISVVSVLYNVRKILDLAVNENEIFILEGERSLLRISPVPDKYSLEMLYQPTYRRTSFNLDDFAAKLKHTAVGSFKKITKEFLTSDDQTSPNSPPTLADEAMELPPIVYLPDGVMPPVLAESYSPFQDNENCINGSSSNNFEYRISAMGNLNTPVNLDFYDEVISRPLHKKKNRRLKNLKSDQESDTASNVSEDRLISGVANDLSLSDESPLTQSNSGFSVLRDVLPLLSQQKNTSKNKETSDEFLKAADTKSETSLDTCESVSENLVASEKFREEQEKTFARLANQSMLDSFNSEKTDNMSVSLNMTSSLDSSRISENLQLPSDFSETSSMTSQEKTSAQKMYNDERNQQYTPMSVNYSVPNINLLAESNPEEKEITYSESLEESGNSQSERININCSQDEGSPKSHIFIDGFYKDVSTSPQQNPAFNSKELGEPLQEAAETQQQSCETNCHSEKLFALVENADHYTDSICNDSNQVDVLGCNPESINYDPPSGSNFIGSQTTSKLTSDINPGLSRDLSDHWCQYKTPESITSLAVSRNYVLCTDANDQVYYSDLSGLGLSWVILDYKATAVGVSYDSSVVWLLNKKTIYSLVNPSTKNPIASSIEEVAHDVLSFCINGKTNDGLIATSNGMLLRHRNDCEELEKVSCGHIVCDVVASEDLIVTLTESGKLLYKTPKENDFNVIKTPEFKIGSMALGPDKLLWLVDEKSNIYFSDDFFSDHANWWQVQITDYSIQNSSTTFHNIYSKIKLSNLRTISQSKSTFVAANENSVWVYNKFSSFVRVQKNQITGYQWSRALPENISSNIYWKAICSEGVFEDKGHVWLLSSDGNIFSTSPASQQFWSIPIPCEDDVVCLASSSDTFWVLSESGRIYSRLGLTEKNLYGNSWRELKLPQIDNLKLIWVSCGCDVAWGCDINGRTFITIGSPHHMATNIFDAAWLEVEGRPEGVQFEKVFVGPQLYMVWAVDINGGLYVREGIFPHYQIGTSWVHVGGIEAIHVSISGSSVWALTPNGKIYRRSGISERNYIGDYWKDIPGVFKMITSSFTDELWGVTPDNLLMRMNHRTKILYRKCDTNEDREYDCQKDINWEIV